jgi:hypothetical protein
VYVTDLPGSYRLSGELTGIFSTGYFTNNGLDDPLTRQDSHTRLDALITLATADGRWSVDVLGRNLTNRPIYVSADGAAQALGTIAIQKEEPRNLPRRCGFIGSNSADRRSLRYCAIKENLRTKMQNHERVERNERQVAYSEPRGVIVSLTWRQSEPQQNARLGAQ